MFFRLAGRRGGLWQDMRLSHEGDRFGRPVFRCPPHRRGLV